MFKRSLEWRKKEYRVATVHPTTVPSCRVATVPSRWVATVPSCAGGLGWWTGLRWFRGLRGWAPTLAAAMDWIRIVSSIFLFDQN